MEKTTKILIGIIAVLSVGLVAVLALRAPDVKLTYTTTSTDSNQANARTDDASPSQNVATPNQRMNVFVWFPNAQLDPNMLDCSKVFKTERTIVQTVAVGKAALEELFKGTTNQEAKDGYFTNIPTGVKIQKLTIENGVAKVDLNEKLEQGVGGSCRTESIRAQITQTLKQFPTVKDVIISINGNSDEILQP